MSKSRGWPLGLADSDVTRLRSYIVQTSACWIWMGALSTDGYGRFGFTDTQTGERRTVTPHRAAAELVLGPAPEGSTHLHDCDVRLCCRVGSVTSGSGPKPRTAGTRSSGPNDPATPPESPAAAR